MFVVQVRSFLVRHRHVRRVAVALLATLAGVTLAVQSHRLDQARAGWVDRRSVWVTDRALEPGDALAVHAVELPLAAIPAGALPADDPVSSLVAAHPIAAGQVITDVDAVSTLRRLAPDGWRTVAVPIGDGSVPLAPGDRVDVVADGIVVATSAVVIGTGTGPAGLAVDGSAVIVVAVPATDAPTVAAAAHDHRADLVGHP